MSLSFSLYIFRIRLCFLNIKNSLYFLDLLTLYLLKSGKLRKSFWHFSLSFSLYFARKTFDFSREKLLAFSIGRLAHLKQTSIGRDKVFLPENLPEANMSDIHDTIPGVFDVKNPPQANMSAIYETIPGVIDISSSTPVSICSILSQTGQDTPDQQNNKVKSRKSSLFESLTKRDSENNLVFLKASNQKDISLL